MADGRLTTWLSNGTHAARPSAPNVGSNGIAIYYETDTTNTFAYISGVGWVQINGSGGGGGPTVLSFGSFSSGYAQSVESFSFSGPTAAKIRLAIAGGSLSGNVGVAFGTAANNIVLATFESNGKQEAYYNAAGGGLTLIKTGQTGLTFDEGVHLYELYVSLDASNNVTMASQFDSFLEIGATVGGIGVITHATLALNGTVYVYAYCTAGTASIVYGDCQLF